MKFLLVPWILLASSLILCADPLDDAASAFERGDFVSAESTLRSLLKSKPSNAPALGLLGAVLDGEKRFDEAESSYRQAIRIDPHSATLLNNYANHQLVTGNKAGARASYLKVVAIDPARANANLQLAQFQVEDKNGPGALRYLQRLPPAAIEEPQVQILQLQALYLAKRTDEARALMTRLENSPDPRLSFTAGLALASIGKYVEAERLFSRALETAPGNFDVLYNLGLASFHAGHLDAARKALGSALTQKPQDVDLLFNLAAVETDRKQQESALRLLSEAARIDPGRPSVQLALAQTASALGYYADAKLAYEKYLKLKPNDQDAEREHLFTVALSEQPREGLIALKAFSKEHPKDTAAHYEVGVLEAKSDPADSAAQFAAALALQPTYTPAKLGQGTLNYLQGKPAAALPDLEFAAAQHPDNAAVLDRLGEVYSALNRPSEAVAALTRASVIAPKDSRILMHLSRAQAKAGKPEAARSTLARFRALGPQPGNLIPQAGVVEFLGLPPEQQQARYKEEVTRRVQEHPDNAEVNTRYLEVLLSEGRANEVSPVIQRLLDLHPPVPIAIEAGEALVRAEAYAPAKTLLDYAAAEAPNDASVQLDLALVELHTTRAQAAITRLNRLPASSSQTGNVLLARAILSEASGNYPEADAAFTQAEKANPVSSMLYQEAVRLLVKHGRQERALQLVRRMPDTDQAESLRASLSY